MAQTVITKAFTEWKAQQAIDNQPVNLDEFIFAYIPDLDVTKPVENTEGLPPADKIVHRQAVSKSGVVNANSVVYSVTLGADVGDFNFNWIGLSNKATGTLAMIIHAPTQSKIKNASGQQGNVLVRSMLMEYSGAVSATNITTPAETWQIDFTARLAAMDERQRRENIDLYGEAAFFGDGYLVAKSGAQYYVTKGAGYVAGLRAELAANQNITVSAKPVKVWLDVSWSGTLTSEWAVKSKITVAASLADYVENGSQHYVFAVASIDASGNITDLRPKGSLNDQSIKEHEKSRNHPDATTEAKGFTQLSSSIDSESETLAATPKAVKIAMDNAGARLAKDRNLSDLTNPAVARQSLELGGSATRNVGTEAGTVAAGDDSRIVGAMQKAKNGADIQDVQMFIQNLGMKETLNPSKRVSIGVLGAGLFDGSKPSINIGDSDSGFIFESDGVIGIYANNQKIAELTNAGIKAIGNFNILSGALILDGDTHFIRHTDGDSAGYAKNNIEIGSWFGIGLTCTYDNLTRIYFNTRTGEIGLKGDLKADGNVYSGANAWLDQTGNLQGSAWGAGVGLKQYIANQIANQKTYIDNGFNKKNTASLGTNGWHRDESTGLITQWGSGNTTTIGANVTFPIPFPNACTSVTSNERNNNITPVIINFSGVGKTGFTVQAWNNNAARVNSDISWTATGY
ncbi:phage tail protein [Enterobacter roggenkampii]|uniref:phage tail-collar fiber domain-containing protein n=1 Tax=Enterobacter roggenkampii TaxID=1812935 RepID=UPI0021C67AD9|nr:phage tail protein [Enterobacter roggenkampii]MCU2344533.1 phage tail protein [Enterobacter roggenkampii]